MLKNGFMTGPVARPEVTFIAESVAVAGSEDRLQVGFKAGSLVRLIARPVARSVARSVARLTAG